MANTKRSKIISASIKTAGKEIKQYWEKYHPSSEMHNINLKIKLLLAG